MILVVALVVDYWHGSFTVAVAVGIVAVAGARKSNNRIGRRTRRTFSHGGIEHFRSVGAKFVILHSNFDGNSTYDANVFLIVLPAAPDLTRSWPVLVVRDANVEWSRLALEVDQRVVQASPGQSVRIAAQLFSWATGRVGLERSSLHTHLRPWKVVVGMGGGPHLDRP